MREREKIGFRPMKFERHPYNHPDFQVWGFLGAILPSSFGVNRSYLQSPQFLVMRFLGAIYPSSFGVNWASNSYLPQFSGVGVRGE